MLLKVTYRDGREKIVDSSILYSLRYKIIKFEPLQDISKSYIITKSDDIGEGHKWKV